MEKCKKEECPGTGIWVPVLLVRKRKEEKPLRVRFGEIFQCEFHKDHGTVADYLSDEGWDKLQKHLREAGKGRFIHSLTTLTWEPATGAEGETECLPF
jgi:hypothetical protein